MSTLIDRHRSVALLLAAVFLACKPSDDAAPSAPAAPAPAAAPAGAPPSATGQDAVQVFADSCAICHGDAGKGDGPLATQLPAAPTSFSNAQWQASVNDEEIERSIRDGGALVGKSDAMPSFPELAAQPGAIPALRAYIRSLAH